jgi:gliding motility-associated-like protein
LYRDPANADFTPTYIPFDNKGTPVGIPIDIIDVSRSTTKPDIGAFEFTICYPLSTPVLTLDSVGVYTIRFAWTPVTNTTGYLVSRDGVNWSIPSSGPMGTTHTVAGLKARDTVGLMVKALGTRWDCQPVYSNRLTGQTVTDQVYIPNTFTPNGNGQNDVFKVYSNIIKSMHLMIFNQWGEKVFETNDPTAGWDGTYKGKPQPVGVYVYVAYMVLSDQTNSTMTKKGTFNLIR